MSLTATSLATELSPQGRLEVLFEELSELAGQRNAIDGRVVQIAAEIDRDGLWGATGVRSVEALVAWKAGVSPHNAEKVLTVARRLSEFPRCAEALCEGGLSLDQVEVITGGAPEGSDEHFAELAASATVTQLRTAISLEPHRHPSRGPTRTRRRQRSRGRSPRP